MKTGGFGESIDTDFSFVPLDGEDEGSANEMFGQVGNVFKGYASKINDGAGFSGDISMHNMRVKITYDPETMLVTEVEPAEDKQ